MAKIDKLATPPIRNEEDLRRAIEALSRRLNEVIEALNTLLP